MSRENKPTQHILKNGENFSPTENVEQMQKLLDVTAALANCVSAEDVASALLEKGFEVLGAQAGLVIHLPENSTSLRVIAARNYPQVVVDSWKHCPPDQNLPVAWALRTGQFVLLEDPDTMRSQFPEMGPIMDKNGAKAFAAIPLKVENRIIAAVGFTFLQPRALSRDERYFLFYLASQCAQSLERALLFDREHARRQELQAAVRARDDFLSIASHELKTPLTSLKLQASLRQKNLRQNNYDYFTRDRLERMVEGDLRQIERLSRLIDDMLDISRIDTGKLTIHKERFDLCEMIHDVVSRYAVQFEAVGSQVIVKDCEPVFGTWDRFRLEQVVANLLTNSLKYGEGKPVQVSVSTDAGKACFVVRDDGLGIASEHHERIFDRFERAISASQVSGLGLGLYIAKEIVEMHGGTIRVESEQGKGAGFVVELPRD